MKPSFRQASLLAALAAGAALIAAACGSESPTATPAPAPTATPTPAPTRAPATPVPTPTQAPPTATPPQTAVVPPTATTAPLPTSGPAPTVTPVPPTPTAVPQQGVPTPIVQGGERGGTLQIKAINMPVAWDTIDARGRGDIHNISPLLNNLIWPDPYGDGGTLVGDLASGWQVSPDGKAITFSLRRGVTYHDGTPFTSKDVVYNFDRGWKPRTATMTAFRAALSVIEKIEAPDDFTVRVTLSQASNAFLANIGQTQFMMYPSGQPFPEKLDDWKKSPIGTGPFRLKNVDPNVRLEFIRNPAYFRPNLPYLDAINMPIIPAADVVLAAFRAGRLDATNFDSTAIERNTKVLADAQGFISQRITNHGEIFMFQQKEPFTDARVREAIDLALDRPALLTLWLEGRGVAYAPPLLVPELGGKWGISAETMKTRPGYRDDKKDDLARARQLLKDAGIDPTKFTINVVGGNLYPTPGAVMERTLADLGFKTKLENLSSAEQADRAQRGAFDMLEQSTTISVDDPGDYLIPWVKTGAGFNFTKASNPKLDDLLAEQDRTLDVAKRKQMLLDAQEIILKDRFVVQSVFRTSFVGYQPWVKNFPPKLPFIFSPWYRYEQVSLVKR